MISVQLMTENETKRLEERDIVHQLPLLFIRIVLVCVTNAGLLFTFFRPRIMFFGMQRMIDDICDQPTCFRDDIVCPCRFYAATLNWHLLKVSWCLKVSISESPVLVPTQEQEIAALLKC